MDLTLVTPSPHDINDYQKSEEIKQLNKENLGKTYQFRKVKGNSNRRLAKDKHQSDFLEERNHESTIRTSSLRLNTGFIQQTREEELYDPSSQTMQKRQNMSYDVDECK